MLNVVPFIVTLELVAEIPKFVKAFATLVAPVPPFPIPKVPLTGIES